jgi:hypothetical protein
MQSEPDGRCRDCGEPVWWQDEQLVSSFGNRWCYGPERIPQMTRHHVLPGMAQYIVPSPLGQECHCLVRAEPHIHHHPHPVVDLHHDHDHHATAVAEIAAKREDDWKAQADLMHADLGDLLRAVGMFAGARPESPHELMQIAISKVHSLRLRVPE